MINKGIQKYAVIRLQGKQYQVSEGDIITADRLTTDEISAEVLLISDDGKVKVGKPIVKGAKVDLKIEEKEVKGVKMDIYKYKAKSRYRKHIGFRPIHSKILVKKIS